MLLGWEDALQGRFARAWKDLSPDKNWRKPILLELMNWGRESWPSQLLFSTWTICLLFFLNSSINSIY